MTEPSASDARPAPHFVCDVQLGRLARWLRLLGFDATYFHDTREEALLALAVREQRLLLTRNRALLDDPGTIPSD